MRQDHGTRTADDAISGLAEPPAVLLPLVRQSSSQPQPNAAGAPCSAAWERARIRLMPGARLPLVGRRDEMAALEDEFIRAAAGEFRVVLLSGEAGVGKSRLGRELLARHPEAVSMFARAHPLGVTAAFGVWADAIDPLLQNQSDRQVMALCGGLLDDLASLFQRVAVIRGSLPDREPPLPRLRQGLAALLRNLAGQAPVIAVLDDVHFADASSWESLRYFARNLDDIRLLVVATSRPADLAGQEVAAQALFELDEDEFLQRLEVSPLDRNAMRELAEAIIGQPAPPALTDWVGQRAGGRPARRVAASRGGGLCLTRRRRPGPSPGGMLRRGHAEASHLLCRITGLRSVLRPAPALAGRGCGPDRSGVRGDRLPPEGCQRARRVAAPLAGADARKSHRPWRRQ
jgi:hypothetical protein